MWAGFYVLAAATLWSTIGVASVLGGDVVLMAFTRSFIAGLAGLYFLRSCSKPSIIAGVLLGVLFSSYPIAAILAGVGTAAYLLYTAPLWTTISSTLLGEKPGIVDIIGVTLILIAVTLIGLDVGAGNVTLAGFITGLVAGISYGLYISVARYYSKTGRRGEVSLAAMPYTLLVTTPMLLAYMVTGRSQLSFEPVIAGVYMAFFNTLIPYTLFTKGVERIGAATASVIATAEPVLAALWGLLLFKQVPTPLTLVAYVVITVALVITALRSR